ncbi:MAG TPA: HlyD family type I secretion periplasmic adaptor subunit [Thermosynechococcaceae cyanobacterium]
MKLSITPAQSQQARQRLANPQESLSYELGKAVQELPPLYTRLLAGGISLLVFGAIAWAHFSRIDEVAVANGKTIPSSEVRPVRALSAGTIVQTKVKAGDQIKQGEVLVEIDPGATGTNLESLEKEAKEIRDSVARLEAESRGELGSGNAASSQLNAARLREFNEKQSAANADANRQVAAIEEARSRLARFQDNRANSFKKLEQDRSILQNAQERLRRLATLEKDNAVPQLDVLSARSQVTTAEKQVTESLDNIASIEGEIQAQNDRIRQAQQAYDSARSTASSLAPQRESEVLAQLAQRREELAKKLGEIDVAKQQRKEREAVKAPFDGTVYNVKVDKGGVQPGEEMLSILPSGKDLVLEVKILNRDVGFIRKGMDVKVKMATFPYQEFGIVPGELIEISPDAVVDKDEAGREMGPVFPAKVRLKKDSIMVRGREVKLSPGLAATAEIVTRQKSILDLLIEPVTRRFSEAGSVR